MVVVVLVLVELPVEPEEEDPDVLELPEVELLVVLLDELDEDELDESSGGAW